MTNGNGSNGASPNGDTPQPDPIQKLTEYVESGWGVSPLGPLPLPLVIVMPRWYLIEETGDRF